MGDVVQQWYVPWSASEKYAQYIPRLKRDRLAYSALMNHHCTCIQLAYIIIDDRGGNQACSHLDVLISAIWLPYT